MKRILVALLMLVANVSIAVAKDAEPDFQIGIGILKNPVRIVCANDFVYVCDTGLSKVLCFDTSDRLLFSSKEGLFESPTGIVSTIDGDIVVCDSVSGQIAVLNRYLELKNTLKFPDDVKIIEPYDICFDYAGILNVLDRGARTVLRISLNGRYFGRYMQPGIGENKLSWPQAIASNGNELAIADAGAGKIIYIGDNFKETRRVGNPGSGPMAVRYPTDVCFDKTGNMLVTDKIISDVNIFPVAGTGTVSWGMHGDANSVVNYFFSDTMEDSKRQNTRNYMDCPMSVAIGYGCVYVADAGLSRIVFEKEESVYKSPKTDFLPFTSQPADIPPVFCDKPAIDFGMVKPNKTYIQKVRIHVCGSGYTKGKVDIVGNYFDVEPKTFIGSVVTLYVKHKSPVKSKNNAILNIVCNGYSASLPLTAVCSSSGGIQFGQNDDIGIITIRSSPVNLDLNLLADPEVVEPLTVSCSKITYKTPWAKVARGVDELTITTLSCQAEPSNLVPSKSNTIKVTLTPTGAIKPGVYSVNIGVSDTAGKYNASRWITVIVKSNSVEKQSTVIQEVFTAHWCEPCAYQREAGYRLFCEYGPRYFMPAAFHVMDDADFATTGLTRPEHYERFKYYGGEGVPVVINNGDQARLLPSSKQLAHDRISGRKCSGTTNDYLKMRGDFDFSNQYLDYQLNVSGDITDQSGFACVEAPGYDFENNTENDLIVLLTEDDIEYSAANGEDYHHFAVRLIAGDHQSDIIKNNSYYRIDFSIPKMPDGYQIIKDKSWFVAFIQNKKTKKVLATGWFKLNNSIDPDPSLCMAETNTVLRRNALVPVTIFITNMSVRFKTFKVSLSTNSGVTVSFDHDFLTISSCSTAPMYIKVDTSDLPSEVRTVDLKINLEDDFGESYTYILQLPVEDK